MHAQATAQQTAGLHTSRLVRVRIKCRDGRENVLDQVLIVDDTDAKAAGADLADRSLAYIANRSDLKRHFPVEICAESLRQGLVRATSDPDYAHDEIAYPASDGADIIVSAKTFHTERQLQDNDFAICILSDLFSIRENMPDARSKRSVSELINLVADGTIPINEQTLVPLSSAIRTISMAIRN